VREREDVWTGLMRSPFQRQRGVSSRFGRHAGASGRGAPVVWRGQGNRSINRGHRAGYLAGGDLKRHTWTRAPRLPMVVRDCPNKLIDALRRRGNGFSSISRVRRDAPGEAGAETASAGEVAAQLQSLPAAPARRAASIAIESASIKDTAAKFR